MANSCATCKWAKDQYCGDLSCEFPLPAWIKSVAIHLEKKRTEDFFKTNNRDANEFTEECCHHNCLTWEARPVVDEEKQEMEGAR